MDYSGLKKPEEYGDGLGTVMGRALTPNEVHSNFLWAGNLIANIIKVGAVFPSFASSWDGFLLMDGKTIGNSASGAALADDKYEDLFNLLKNFPDYGNTGSEDFASGDTVYLPDQAAKILRGAINGGVEAADWDIGANTVDLGRSDIPFGTPFKIDDVPAGMTAGPLAGTVYYLGLASGTYYYLYTSESYANANDGSSGLVALSGTVTGDCNYTSLGTVQDKSMWGHHIEVSGFFNSGGISKTVYGTTVGSQNRDYDNPSNSMDLKADNIVNDGTHGIPELSNEGRIINTQMNYFIKY